MADENPLSDFSFPASPGDYFPPIMGDPGEEAASETSSPPPSLVGPMVPSTAGFLGPPTTNNGSLLGVNNRAYYCPVYVPRPARVEALEFRVTVIGSAGAVARVGIYSTDYRITHPNNPQFGMPRRLLVDGGTTPTTTAGGWTVGIPLTYLPEGLIWTVLVPQGSPATQATFTAVNSPNPWVAGGLNTAGRGGVEEDSVSGALTEYAGMSNSLLASSIPMPFAILSLDRFLE